MSTHEGFWTANGEFCLLDARANENFNLLLMYSQLFLHDVSTLDYSVQIRSPLFNLEGD